MVFNSDNEISCFRSRLLRQGLYIATNPKTPRFFCRKEVKNKQKNAGKGKQKAGRAKLHPPTTIFRRIVIGILESFSLFICRMVFKCFNVFHNRLICYLYVLLFLYKYLLGFVFLDYFIYICRNKDIYCYK